MDAWNLSNVVPNDIILDFRANIPPADFRVHYQETDGMLTANLRDNPRYAIRVFLNLRGSAQDKAKARRSAEDTLRSGAWLIQRTLAAGREDEIEAHFPFPAADQPTEELPQ